MVPKMIDLLLVVLVIALIVYTVSSVLDWLVPLCFTAGVVYVFVCLKKDGRF